VDFPNTRLPRFSLRIAVNAQQIAGIQLEPCSDALNQPLGRVRQPTEIRPSCFDRALPQMFSQQPDNYR
jgi:hypothetical protein